MNLRDIMDSTSPVDPFRRSHDWRKDNLTPAPPPSDHEGAILTSHLSVSAHDASSDIWADAPRKRTRYNENIDTTVYHHTSSPSGGNNASASDSGVWGNQAHGGDDEDDEPGIARSSGGMDIGDGHHRSPSSIEGPDNGTWNTYPHPTNEDPSSSPVRDTMHAAVWSAEISQGKGNSTTGNINQEWGSTTVNSRISPAPESLSLSSRNKNGTMFHDTVVKKYFYQSVQVGGEEEEVGTGGVRLRAAENNLNLRAIQQTRAGASVYSLGQNGLRWHHNDGDIPGGTGTVTQPIDQDSTRGQPRYNPFTSNPTTSTTSDERGHNVIAIQNSILPIAPHRLKRQREAQEDVDDNDDYGNRNGKANSPAYRRARRRDNRKLLQPRDCR